jgi:hypothetical protein
LGIRRFGAFDSGPSGLLGCRHPGSHGGRPAMFLCGFNKGSLRDFTPATSDGVNLALESFNLLLDGDDAVELAGR